MKSNRRGIFPALVNQFYGSQLVATLTFGTVFKYSNLTAALGANFFSRLHHFDSFLVD